MTSGKNRRLRGRQGLRLKAFGGDGEKRTLHEQSDGERRRVSKQAHVAAAEKGKN